MCYIFTGSCTGTRNTIASVIVCTKLPVVCVPIVIKLFRVVAPVPPSPTASVPVMDDASSLTASLFDSKTKPPSAFVSTDNV